MGNNADIADIVGGFRFSGKGLAAMLVPMGQPLWASVSEILIPAMTTADTKRKRNPGGGRRAKPKASLPADPKAAALVFDSKPGLRAAIERLRQAEIRAAQDFQLALSTEDPGLIGQKKKDWLDLCEALRKIEVSNPDVQKANAETVPVAEVERETARLCNAFRVALESLPRSLPQRLVGADIATIQETLTKGIAEALAHLHTGKWSETK
jgi:hypothetical protein